MKRTPLARSTPIKRTAPIKPKPRTTREWRRIYGSVERVNWIAAQPCVACGDYGEGYCENAHVANGGMGRKADAEYIIPLCPMCHEDFHQYGREWFERAYAIGLIRSAAETEKRWQAYQGTT